MLTKAKSTAHPPVAQPGTDAVEVLAAGADKAHAHIEAGNEEDTCQQDAAHGAEQQAHHIGEGLPPRRPGWGSAPPDRAPMWASMQ